jgi:hypothetical protein
MTITSLHPTEAEVRALKKVLEERNLLETLHVICREYNVLLGAVLGKKRSARVCMARDACFHRLLSLGFSMGEIGEMSGFERTSVGAAVQRHRERLLAERRKNGT